MSFFSRWLVTKPLWCRRLGVCGSLRLFCWLDDVGMTKLVREPIYQQLNKALRDLMNRGEFAVGSKFLSEREVATRFDVSRTTANKALASLVAAGLLDFRKGVGTFVTEPVLNYDMRSLVSFTDKARAAGKMPSTRVLEFRQGTADEADSETCHALDVAGDDALFFIDRLRLADDEPVIFEQRVVVERFCPGLTQKDLTESLYSAWVEQFGLEISDAQQTIRAVNLSAKMASILNAEVGVAALELTCTGFVDGHNALWHERTCYRGDAYQFHSVLGGGQAGSQTHGVLS